MSDIPVEQIGTGGRRIEGAHNMSLRDYFAAAALQGLMAYGPPADATNIEVAEKAYRLAEAMLEARKP